MKSNPAIFLPHGVKIDREASRIYDAVRKQGIPLNETATALVDALQRADSLTVAASVAASTGADLARVESDVSRLIAELNGAALANCPRKRLRNPSHWLLSIALSLMAGTLPSEHSTRTVRHHIDTTSAWRTIKSTARAFLSPAVRIASGLTIIPVLLAVGTGGSLQAAMFFLAVGAAVLVALVSHEIGHGLALRGLDAAAVVTGTQMRIVHAPRTGRRSLIAISGPAFGGLMGLSVSGLAAMFGILWLGIAGLVISLQMVALCVASADGRHALGISIEEKRSEVNSVMAPPHRTPTKGE